MIWTFGTYDAERHPRVAVLVAGLRAHGAEVAELNRPLGFSTAERVRMLQQPWRLPLLALRLLACWTGLVAGAFRLRRRHGRPEAVLVGYMGHFDVVLARVLFPRSVVVLDHLIFAGDTAADRGAAGLRVRLLNVLDRVATSCADLVITDTDEHRAMLPAPAKGVTVPVGAPATWFDAADRPMADGGPSADGQPMADGGPSADGGDRDQLDADAPGGALRLVFFGLYTPLQGAAVIAEAIRDAVASGTDLRVTMIGTGQDLGSAREILAGTSGITWHGWVEPAELPALVARHDVCLGIFSDTPKGLRVVPNKVYQGLAAGCVVVTSDTPPQRRAVGEVAELVPPGDPAALSATLTALTDPARLAEARTRLARGRASVRPESVVEPLLTALTRPPAVRTRRGRDTVTDPDTVTDTGARPAGGEPA
ncbi:glycosyltransferase [Myceligenerans indicum]|uniref:Glycosyltransferase family 4 protein n=1 Tax=Myceligenerans indicum TaxID=2593663 RepID=A0ABS1LI56_9MICO|nr:glycosyltransferase [Myceligenerans indicum]MBL0885877.1 glycosyltransferase family 4 protein [Myceligenerans indicum]